MREKTHTESTTSAGTLFSTWYNLRLRLFLESALAGLAAGMLGVAFRLALGRADAWREVLLAWAREVPGYGWAVFLPVLLALGALAGWLTRFAPEAAGSGIPHVEAVLLEQRRLVWWRLIPVKFLAGVFAIGAGLSLGREGPTVQLGAASGQAMSRILKRSHVEERYLITCGAGAGLAAAFNAPLAGVVFVLEELRRNFSPYVFLSALTASVAAGAAAQRLLGLRPLLPLAGIAPLPPSALPLFILLGLITGFFGVAFNSSLSFTQDLYARLEGLPRWLHPVLATGLAGLIGYFLTPAVLGGGHALVEQVLAGEVLLKFIPLFLVAKFILTMVSYGSGVPGGIFLPLLAIGALLGSGLGQVADAYFPGIAGLSAMCAAAGMAAYFTAIVRAPITGIVLILELTGSYANMLFVLAACLTAYLVAEGLKSLPVYEMLLERDLARGADAVPGTCPEGMMLVELTVETGSCLDRHLVREVDLPGDCLLLAIRRGSQELVPRGNTKVRAGDQVAFLIPREKAAQVIPRIRSLTLCQLEPEC
ncbi:H(+)/Cl(-) exchange transporter ClcA [Gelria sp. Kuro-4]|uniref:H(+)/Cl(-) exchange transporter ClcA n=1 Tax=Gelria sp. Kuro-4 TaxID=2796927 RepID=UPI001BEE63F8|nr:H(+)/Cl(-) exchange transporter ClcA [Gelria sp. Kuro-4]BCV23713.1 chloride ion channel protein [Gelria sp. Kuro-4]